MNEIYQQPKPELMPLVIKKMRLHRGLNRQEASRLFEFSDKLIERLENSRAPISPERLQLFIEKYQFSPCEFNDLVTGKLQVSHDANSIRKKNTKKRPDKRFTHRYINRECKVLKELRLRLQIDQYSASERCGFNKNKIGFIENGRISLSENLINLILNSYGYSMELFYQLLKQNPLPHEMIEEAHEIISTLSENKLLALLPMLRGFK
jgi:transcriptional regulator with XRE-family HTH domain